MAFCSSLLIVICWLLFCLFVCLVSVFSVQGTRWRKKKCEFEARELVPGTSSQLDVPICTQEQPPGAESVAGSGLGLGNPAKRYETHWSNTAYA